MEKAFSPVLFSPELSAKERFGKYFEALGLSPLTPDDHDGLVEELKTHPGGVLFFEEAELESLIEKKDLKAQLSSFIPIMISNSTKGLLQAPAGVFSILSQDASLPEIFQAYLAAEKVAVFLSPSPLLTDPPSQGGSSSKVLEKRLAWLQETAQMLQGQGDFSSSCRILLERFIEDTKAQGGSLFLCHEGHLERIHSTQPDHVPETIPFPLKKNSVFEYVLHEKSPLLINEIESRENLEGSGWQGYQNTSCLILPLWTENKEIAAIVSLHGKLEGFSTEDLALANILSCIGSESLTTAQALRKLQDSEEKYRVLIESSPSMVVQINPAGSISFINQSALEFFGFSKEEVLGKSITESIFQPLESPYPPPLIADLLRDLEEAPTSYLSKEWDCKKKNAAIMRILWHYSLSNHAKKEVQELLFWGHDITDKRKSEVALKESETRWKTIFDAVPTGIFVLDSASNMIVDANPMTCSTLGADLEEIQGAAFEDYFQQGGATVSLEALLEESMEYAKATLHYQGKKEIPVLVRGNHVDLGGEKRILICFIDISEQEEAKEEGARLSLAMEYAAEMLVIANFEGRIEYVNTAFESITGYSRTEVIGEPVKILKSSVHDQQFYDSILETLKENKVWKGRIVNAKKDGSHFEAEMTISPMRTLSGKVVNYVSILRDVTKEAKLESQLRQAQKLEAIGELASGIAHEINTPTQYIGDNLRFFEESFSDILSLLEEYGGLLEAIEKGEDPGARLKEIRELQEECELSFLIEETPAAIERSLEGNRRVAEIVRAMKEFAHPGAEEMTPIDINHTLKNTIAVARNEWKYVAEVELELCNDLPMVKCIPGSINQVFLNLIVNAAHAIDSRKKQEQLEEKGSITISTSHDEHWVEIRIHDTGTGISQELQERIFEPFFTTKEVGKGTGQGLAIAHSVVVDTHHGEITIESEPGAGATFVIHIPMMRDEEDE